LGALLLSQRPVVGRAAGEGRLILPR